MAACIGLTRNKKLFEKVVPIEQSLSENYSGIFHFR
ncbi:MAG: C2 family cysteine protease [Dolichospermum sp.]